MAYIFRYNSGNNIKEVIDSSNNTDSVIIATFRLGPKDSGATKLGNNVTSWCKSMKINGDEQKSLFDEIFLPSNTFYTIEYTLKDASKISASTFDGCSKLNIITLPTSIQLIQNDAFKGCTAYIRISNPIPPTIAEDAFAKFGGKVEVPEAYAEDYTEAWGNVVTIGTY